MNQTTIISLKKSTHSFYSFENSQFQREEDAERAAKDLNNRWFDGRPIYAELSPVTDFKMAGCHQYRMTGCTRSSLCNFMHLKPISNDLRRFVLPFLFFVKSHWIFHLNCSIIFLLMIRFYRFLRTIRHSWQPSPSRSRSRSSSSESRSSRSRSRSISKTDGNGGWRLRLVHSVHDANLSIYFDKLIKNELKFIFILYFCFTTK